MPDTIKRMQYIYRLQQSKLTSLSYLTDGLGSVRENLEHFIGYWPESYRTAPTGVGWLSGVLSTGMLKKQNMPTLKGLLCPQ